MNKYKKVINLISIICSIVGLILAMYGFFIGIESNNETGYGAIGIIFIMPSIISIIIILVDLLVTLNKIKNGLIYSIISSIIKIAIIVCCIPSTIYDYEYELKYGTSNLSFDLLLILSLAIITIPSVLNSIKRIKSNK